MMEVLVAFAGFGLFIIHELEEIARFVPWIRRYEHDPAFVRQMLIAHRTAYPSTETVAIIILEESIVALALLGGAIALHSLALVCAVILVNMLHLVGHLVDAAKYRNWTPGSITALATLLGNGVCIAYSFVAVPQVIGVSLILTPVAGLLLIGNLMFMLSRSQAIEWWRTKHL
jgi:hypothetical protein